MGVNKAILIGNLGADPELKETKDGQPVLRLRVATTERYRDKDGETQERTEWHSVTVWGKRGEALHKILAKGRSIYVEGRIQTRSWEKDGDKRYSTEINAVDIQLLGGGSKREDGDRDAPREQRATREQGRARRVEADMPDDDEIPF